MTDTMMIQMTATFAGELWGVSIASSCTKNTVRT